jgi:hypothetical protein
VSSNELFVYTLMFGCTLPIVIIYFAGTAFNNSRNKKSHQLALGPQDELWKSSQLDGDEQKNCTLLLLVDTPTWDLGSNLSIIQDGQEVGSFNFLGTEAFFKGEFMHKRMYMLEHRYSQENFDKGVTPGWHVQTSCETIAVLRSSPNAVNQVIVADGAEYEVAFHQSHSHILCRGRVVGACYRLPFNTTALAIEKTIPDSLKAVMLWLSVMPYSAYDRVN